LVQRFQQARDAVVAELISRVETLSKDLKSSELLCDNMSAQLSALEDKYNMQNDRIRRHLQKRRDMLVLTPREARLLVWLDAAQLQRTAAANHFIN